MNPDPHEKIDPEEESLCELLRGLDSDAAPVDPVAIAQAVQAAGDVFAASGPEQAPRRSGESAELTQNASKNAGTALGVFRPAETTRATETARSVESGDRKMLIVMRAVVAVSAAVLATVAMFFQSEPASGNSTLGTILDQTVAAATLQLQAVRDGAQANVWVRDGSVRWEKSATAYLIAAGATLWEVDEDANTVARRSNEWLGETRAVDLLAMLGLDDATSTEFRNARSSGSVPHDGRECSVFKLRTKRDAQPLLLEAFVDAKSRALISIAAWPDGVEPRVGPPIAELRLIAKNVAVDEDKFRVAKSLTEDGRIGRVTDSQGLVTLKPPLHRRWTPVARQLLVRPGDWIRTDVRGANATTISLTSQFDVIVGPGSLVEFLTPRRVRLIGGELQVRGSAGADETFELLGPESVVDRAAVKRADHEASGHFVSVKAGETVLYRLVNANDQSTLRKVEKPPVWLSGYEGSSNNESIGSLIANIDGRNVPLTVGFHKVSVEIRDQIARTTIEESFVNRTLGRLEGVFHFPLPQDASISGFGMWIGGELIEADVVEKQRAREIYETILREKRDPGLLEWTGGNIFKARVFPIEPQSEKRIKIVYTQVLPLRANQYRYSYGLRSELLRTTPLRELSLDVLVHSALPLKSVTCPTHPVRSSFGGEVGGGAATMQSAHLEFAAQEYSPDRDFEVVCEIDSKQSDVVVVPHQRGDDGYFLMQLTPPSPDGNWSRELLPDGEPLEVLLVCDTSASMDDASREQQAAFVASVLATLGPDDRFNIAVCDVDCRWLFEEPVAASDEHAKQSRQWLSDRVSLGWTDLDRMTASCFERATGKSHVIYIGDGIVTAGDADPQAIVGRLKRASEKPEQPGSRRSALAAQPVAQPSFHAVSVSSSFDSTVLKALASVGRGSVRSISGEQTPQRVALELLNEIAQPGLTDLKVEFRGLQVAAVYPGTLPNLAAGTQQILVGRYLPTGANQSGEIVVTGNRGGEPVTYAARVSLKNAETGNSFIPRLWARAHLDALLAQGSSSFIKDEIIALSEEFHIITPYTSLLVLETDADRERFGVQRRFLMRDGERFFADGRSAASFDLLQQQMKRAGDWRLNLRRQVLSTLAELGRDSEAAQQLSNWVQAIESKIELVDELRRSEMSRPMSGSAGRSSGFYRFGKMSGLAGGSGGALRLSESLSVDSRLGRIDSLQRQLSSSREEFEMDSKPDDSDSDSPFDEQSDFSGEKISRGGEFGGLSGRGVQLEDQSEGGFLRSDLDTSSTLMPTGGFGVRAKRSQFRSQRGLSGGQLGFEGRDSAAAKPQSMFFSGSQPVKMESGRLPDWFAPLFPPVSAPRPEALPMASHWPEDAVALSNGLLQAPQFADGRGLSIAIHTENFDPRWKRVTHVAQTRQWRAADRWLTRPTAANGQTIVDWCDAKERGLYSRAFQTGRVRPTVDRDLSSVSSGDRAYAETPLHQTFAGYEPRIERLADDRVRLHLTDRRSKAGHAARVTIDTARNVVLKIESLRGDAVVSTTDYSDYVQALGVWFASRIERFDERGRRISVTTQSATELAPDDLAKAFEGELPYRGVVRLLPMKLPTVPEAEVAAQNGSAGFEERLILLLNAARIQNHDEALKQFAEIEKAATVVIGKPVAVELPAPLRWLRIGVLTEARRFEEARQSLSREAERLTAPGTDDVPSADDYFLAEHLIAQVGRLGDANEQLRLLETLKPVFERQPEFVNGDWNFKRYRLAHLNALERVTEALALNRELAEAAIWDVNVQTQYAYALSVSGDVDAGLAWLRTAIDQRDDNGEFISLEHEEATLRNTSAGLLRDRYRYDELVEFLADWVARQPQQATAYRQYLSALIFADRLPDADATANQWIESGVADEQLEPAELARLNSAIQYALGSRDHFYLSWIDPQWLPLLERVALHFLQHEQHADIASEIVGHYYFVNSDQGDSVRREIARRLKASASELPLPFVQSFVDWVVDRRDLTTDDWSAIARALRTRWETLNAADQQDDRFSLGNALSRILATHFAETEYLPFLRQRIARAEQGDKPGYVFVTVNALFDALLARDWNDALEAESLALIPRISTLPADWQVRDLPTPIENPKSDSGRLADQIAALHRFVDRMLEARYQAAESALQDAGHPEELTRTELAAKQAEFRSAAYEGLSDRLAQRAAPAGNRVAAALSEWIQVERMYLDLRLGRNLEQVAAQCFELLGDSPATSLRNRVRQNAGDARKDVDPEDAPRSGKRGGDGSERGGDAQIDLLRGILRDRTFATVSYLAARRSAPDELVARVLAYVDAGIEANDDTSDFWKQALYGLLIALDRPDELQQRLRDWVKTDEYAAPWQLALGRLLAERGAIEEAITLFETVQKKNSGTLPAGDFAVLADWYLVTNQRARHQRAKIEIFKSLEEWEIGQWLNQKRQRWYRSDVPLPTELEEDVLFAFQALFEKSDQPGQYLNQLRDFYRACRDFRLLKMVPDAVVGRTPQQVYDFLKHLSSNLLTEMRTEATADEILARIVELRASRAGRPEQTSRSELTAIDLRALDLLEALIERRASEVLNEPGPHVAAAVAALQRAFQHDWADGELRQMAEFLDNLGHISQQPIDAERLRQLRALQSVTKPGSDDHLVISWYLARVLFESTPQREEALAVMEIAVREFTASHPNGWPAHANPQFSGWLQLLMRAQRHARAEQICDAYLEHPANEQQRLWLMRERNSVRTGAVNDNGSVSLGNGSELYDNVLADLHQQVAQAADENHRNLVLDQVLRLLRVAHARKISRSQADIRRFANEQLLPILTKHGSQYRNLTQTTAQLVHEVNGPVEGLEFLILCFESCPARFDLTYESPWHQHAYNLANWFNESGSRPGTKELEPRLLAVVLKELRRDLETRQQRSRYLYHRNYGVRFWEEKTDDFARVSEEVYTAHRTSERFVTHLAAYHYSGLNRYDRAIELLLIAHREGRLSSGTRQNQLVRYLHERNRHAESIPVLEELIDAAPLDMSIRVLLMTAYSRTGRTQQLDELIAETDQLFRDGGRWIESSISQLARLCSDENLHALAVKYYSELIPLHQRTAPHQGIGGNQLSDYYSRLARAHTARKEMIKAVEAASAAIVAWGPRHDQRQSAIHWLDDALQNGGDLDEYVKHLDATVAESGQDSPLIRQKIGTIYSQRGQHEPAIAQFKLSLELQPDDVETRKALIEAYDRVNDQSNAVRETLALLDLDRHNLDLYRNLAERLKDDETQSERALTTIVEAAPSEAEHHQVLAELLQQRDRWPEAVSQWQHVAKLRALEPTGLLNLAAAQVHLKEWEAAQESLKQLQNTVWPARFSDVDARVRELLRQIPESK